MSDSAQVLILGTGVAGCAAALAAARGGSEVAIVTRASEAEASNTLWAQGGIVGRPPDDRPENLAADIEKAGDGLCFPQAVDLLAREGPDLVQKLLVEELGIPFDRENSGFNWTREGGHAIPRILHVKDETGMPIERALLEACGRESRIRWLLQTTAVDLLTLSHDSTDPTDRYRPPAVVGAYLLERSSGRVRPFLARETILATGGLGRVYLHTTNPQGSRGDGIAMARRAGARAPEPRVRPVPPDRSLSSPWTAPADRGPARRGGADHRRVGPAVPARGAPGRGACAARRRGPRHPPAHARARRAVRAPGHLSQAGRVDPRAVSRR